MPANLWLSIPENRHEVSITDVHKTRIFEDYEFSWGRGFGWRRIVHAFHAADHQHSDWKKGAILPG